MIFTSVDTKQICDECGKTVDKIWRVENKHKYCATCYARVFKRTICPKCGNFARLNKYNKNAICAACIRAKPCARCGKTEYESGKLTPYGMVCNSCAPHFRDKEPCELCGTLSSRLSRNARLGNNLRLCPKCIRADHATCQACKRHRLLMLSNGKTLCNACVEQGQKPCTLCNQLMPAGYGKICEACYWKGLLDKRTAINCATFRVAEMENHFSDFAIWLGQDVGVHKVAITINRYVPFFLAIENKFGLIPNYSALLEHFSPAKLRKNLLPMRWMVAAGLLIVDVIAREDDTEKRRIASLLDKVGVDTAERKLLNGYYQLLINDLKHTKTTLRSVRLALSPAFSLLLIGAEMRQIPPNQRVLDAYLHKSAGQRAAVTGFVNYLRDIHSVDIKLPKLDTRKSQLNSKKKLEVELLALMKSGGDSLLNREWLSVALAYYHGLPRKAGKTVTEENIVVVGDGGIRITWNGVKYWIQARQ